MHIVIEIERQRTWESASKGGTLGKGQVYKLTRQTPNQYHNITYNQNRIMNEAIAIA